MPTPEILNTIKAIMNEVKKSTFSLSTNNKIEEQPLAFERDIFKSNHAKFVCMEERK